MPIDSRVQNGAIGALIVFALGAGLYSVPADFEGEVDLVEVGWWNIRNFSSSSRDDDEMELIAAGVGEMDVFAVGELNDPVALSRLASELGTDWQARATDQRIGRTPNTAEYYGFVWDASRFEMVGDIQQYSDPGDRFDRDPVWARFRTLDRGFDFTVICVHITWGSTTAARKAEIRALPDVWRAAQNASGEDEDLILVGDFNRNVGDASFAGLIALQGVLRANEDTGPTHISSNSTYDQIFLSIRKTTEWTGEWETYAFDEDLFGDDDAEANLAGSDHRPVWVTLYITSIDDD